MNVKELQERMKILDQGSYQFKLMRYELCNTRRLEFPINSKFELYLSICGIYPVHENGYYYLPNECTWMEALVLAQPRKLCCEALQYENPIDFVLAYDL